MSDRQPPTETTNAPIFILGMLQRTGTNHLWDLFGLHPDIEQLRPVFEDHLVRWTPHLVAYVDDVSRGWSPEWDVPDSERTDLKRSLGIGVQSWLAGHSTKRIVTKMPSVEQAINYLDFFPDSPLVLIIRDGRSVCESGVTSFGWSYERAFRRWRQSADIVLELQEQHRDNPLFSVVRYEDIVERPTEVMRRLCATSGLDVETFPFDQIEALPVRGSSSLATVGGSEIHWTPVERSETFDPRERWRSWDEHQHRRFAAVAGPAQEALGYSLEPVSGKDSLSQRASDLRDLADVRWRETRVKAGRAKRSVRRVHGRI